MSVFYIIQVAGDNPSLHEQHLRAAVETIKEGDDMPHRPGATVISSELVIKGEVTVTRKLES